MPGTLGIIGGSGLYDLPGMSNVGVMTVDTPYGPPSAPVVTGQFSGHKVAFLSRHGSGHRLNPSEVPYRANIHAFKQLGVTHLVGISAVGSLQVKLIPGTMVVPDQIIDRTIRSDRSFFENGIVAHVSLADPFCAGLSDALTGEARKLDLPLHDGGTYICIEGPQFSTRAESHLYRTWDAGVIGMTAMPEARLAREAGMCYAIVATVTDYDVWHDSEEDVSVASVLAVLAKNVDRSKRLISELASRDLPRCTSGCASAAIHAVSTHPDAIDEDRNALLAFLTSSTSGTEG